MRGTGQADQDGELTSSRKRISVGWLSTGGKALPLHVMDHCQELGPRRAGHPDFQEMETNDIQKAESPARQTVRRNSVTSNVWRTNALALSSPARSGKNEEGRGEGASVLQCLRVGGHYQPGASRNELFPRVPSQPVLRKGMSLERDDEPQSQGVSEDDFPLRSQKT